jgi:hypothetical protein
MIDDKEVGKIWALLPEVDNRHWVKTSEALIRKLVGERKRIYEEIYLIKANKKDAQMFALRDYGIDPTTWPKE